jgi:hypothetical protein
MIPWELGDRGQGVEVRVGKESKDRRAWGLANTRKNSIEVHGLSIHLLGIIRTGREGVEKPGVEGLMCGVQGMGIRGGRADNLEK